LITPEFHNDENFTHVLHVDDDDDHLMITKHIFNKIDPLLKLESVTSPEKALELLKKRTFDCVISDILFPGIDGIEFARQVKKIHNIPLIFFTGIMSEEMVEAAFSAGADDYVQKGLGNNHYFVLVKRIKNIIDKHKAENVIGVKEEEHRVHEKKGGGSVSSEETATVHRIVSILNHDLRGVFQNIITAAELLKEKNEKSEEMLNVIKNSVKKGIKTLDRLHLQTQDTRLDVKDIDLTDLVLDVLAELNVPESIDVKFNYGKGVNSVLLDTNLIHNVLYNVIVNALEAMPHGGKLTIKADKDNYSIYIEVSDTGVGIPKERINNLFKPFFSTKPKGIGLGLVYCKRVIEAHGGIISVISEEGQGTSVFIQIPQ